MRHASGRIHDCAYPSFLNASAQPASVLKRLLGFQGNASSLDHAELDGSFSLQSDSLEDWGNRMVALNKNHGVKILGGCCGTDVNHLKYLVEKLSPNDWENMNIPNRRRVKAY